MRSSRALLTFAFAAIAFAATDPWTASDLLPVSSLAEGAHPNVAVYMVGPRLLYNANHLVKAVYTGPASKDEGVTRLLQAVSSLPKDAALVIYCGCCPMDMCPNVRPAFTALKQAGFQHVKVLDIPSNLKTDWTQKGYPVEKGSIEK